MTSIQSSGGAGRRAAAALEPLVTNWWMMAGRGVLAVLFGTVILLWRIPAFDAVIVSFGTYAIADGILAIASALRAARPWTAGWPIALEGIVSVVLGVLAFTWPFFPHRVLVVLVAWGLLTGIFELVAAVRLPRSLAAHWLVGTGGASSVFLALVVLALPRADSDRVAQGLAVYAIVFGIVILLAAFRFRSVNRRRGDGHEGPEPRDDRADEYEAERQPEARRIRLTLQK
jgi:uncharacterized membrane protein HdeD (DUF308 family)